jgi:hypothetical protein
MRQHTPAYVVGTHQHTSAYVSIRRRVYLIADHDEALRTVMQRYEARRLYRLRRLI